MIISFDSGVDLIQDFTDDPEKLAGAVQKIRAGGGTSLYDAIYLAAQDLDGREGRHVMIVVTDGGDTTSTKDFHAAQTIQRGRREASEI